MTLLFCVRRTDKCRYGWRPSARQSGLPLTQQTIPKNGPSSLLMSGIQTKQVVHPLLPAGGNAAHKRVRLRLARGGSAFRWRCNHDEGFVGARPMEVLPNHEFNPTWVGGGIQLGL